jgi:hypothetical protein
VVPRDQALEVVEKLRSDPIKDVREAAGADEDEDEDEKS